MGSLDFMKATIRLLIIALIGLLQSCSEQVLTDVSEDPQFQSAIGTRYEIVGPLDAYGIRRHSGAPVHYVTLIPLPGIEGPEVGFESRVSIGSTITVLKVTRTNRLTDSKMTLLVQLEGTQLPSDVPIRIDLIRGNEGSGKIGLNPAIYKKLASD